MAALDDKENKGIRRKLLLVVLLPIVVFGIFIVIFGMSMLYRSYTKGIQDELVSTTNVMIDCLEFATDGDYSYKDNSLYKGGLNITNPSMVYRSKDISEIDTTIFWQDIRVVTTVKNGQGVPIVGTKASPKVVQAVLKEGKNYYSDHLNINGVGYIGYYTPLENSDHSIIGMVFAGKSKKSVYHSLTSFLMGFLLVGLVSTLIAIILSHSFSDRMVKDIGSINDFLKHISNGDLSINLDGGVQERDDELGSIGLYAEKMRGELKTMIEMDPLTSLFNRRSVNNKLKKLEKEKKIFSIVMCDVDWFKKINDTYGHDAGDYILVTLSQIFMKNIGDDGFAGRWGGEEFLLVYRMGMEDTLKRVEEMKETITAYDFKYGNDHIKVSMTFGIEGDDLSENYEKRIKKADDRLYIGKNSGRNRIIYKEDEKAG